MLLLRQLGITAAIATVIILVMSSFGIHRIYEEHVINYARNNAISLGQAFVASERESLLKNFGVHKSIPVTDSSALIQIDNQIDSFLTPYRILKIKVFSSSGQIVYSTDHDIIGQQDDSNYRLKMALNGETDSQVQKKNQISDLTGETRFNVDVVETYVPIRNHQQKVIGAFEIYQDMSREYLQIERGVKLSIFTLSLILLFIYISAFYFIRKSGLRLQTAQQQLERLAITDPLTSLFNRREILKRADSELARFKRASKESPHSYYCLLMIDIDNFKQINDAYGHLVGDQALKQVALLLKKTLRSYCDIGRYGGEEFLVIIPDATLTHAESIAERLIRTVEEITLEDVPELKMSISIGCVVTNKPQSEFEEVLFTADQLMYQAKAKGKNGVVAQTI